MFLWRRYFRCVLLLLLLLLSLIYSCLAGFKEYGSLTKQSFSFSTKHFLSVWNVLSVTAFCIRICRLQYRVSSFKLSLALIVVVVVVVIIIIIMVLHRQNSAVIVLLCCCWCRRRRRRPCSSPCYFPWTNGDAQRSSFKFQTAARIVCDVPCTAAFCSISIECLLGMAFRFFLKRSVTIPGPPIIAL